MMKDLTLTPDELREELNWELLKLGDQLTITTWAKNFVATVDRVTMVGREASATPDSIEECPHKAAILVLSDGSLLLLSEADPALISQRESVRVLRLECRSSA